MKTLKLLQTGLVLLLTLAGVSAHADPAPIAVNALELKNVAQTSNRAVTVFYAVGSAATVAVGNGVPFIRKITGGPFRADIRSNGSASISAGESVRNGFQIFNYLVFVVSPSNEQNVYVCNADGTVPSADGITNEKCSGDYMSNVRFIYRPVQLNSTRTAVSQIGSTPVSAGSTVTLDLGSQ